MRWIMLAILTYLLTLLQISLVDIITIRVPGLGLVRPELLAIVVVYAALHVRSILDAVLVGWALGLTLDITTCAGSAVSTAVGPMSLAYALAAGGIYKARAAVFRDKVVTQCVTTMVFCVAAHWMWIMVQWPLAFGDTTGVGIVLMLVQAVLLAVYTAAIAPALVLGLKAGRRWLITSPTGQRRGRR